MRRRGFTLIELLFVVVVIAILAAIGVPNFLEAQVRSKMSRTTADLSVVEAALHAYYADYRTYPQSTPPVVDLMRSAWTFRDEDAATSSTTAPVNDPWGAGWYSHTTDFESEFWRAHQQDKAVFFESGYDLAVLTTPVAYVIGGLRPDPFADTRDLPFVYFNPPQCVPEILGQSNYPRYVLLSYGPDTDQWSPSDVANPMLGPYISYDPTNGTVSSGDVFRDGFQ
ncbi:type II secretion system GspH family protein [bacterium]|nr:type II secretion system GspH family protein [bacterium]